MKDLNSKIEYKRKELADATGLSIETIRFYESKELVFPRRDSNGYRVYSESDVQRVIFVSHVKQLGFSLNEAHELLSLNENNKNQAHEKVFNKIEELNQKINKLTKIKNSLEKLSKSCCTNQNNKNNDCSILKCMNECNEEKWHNAHRHKRNS